MTTSRRAGAAALASFALGAAVLLISTPDLLRLAGAVLMIVAVFLGAAAIATPELLGRDEDDGPGG